MKKLDCEPCASVLFHEDTGYARIRADYILIDQKDNGGLFIPSQDLVSVCKEAELVVREYQGKKNLKSAEIRNLALKRLVTNSNLFSNLRYTLTEDHTAQCTHVLDLFKQIVTQYANIRLHHIAKERTLSSSGECIRNFMNKAVHFQGQ